MRLADVFCVYSPVNFGLLRLAEVVLMVLVFCLRLVVYCVSTEVVVRHSVFLNTVSLGLPVHRFTRTSTGKSIVVVRSCRVGVRRVTH